MYVNYNDNCVYILDGSTQPIAIEARMSVGRTVEVFFFQKYKNVSIDELMIEFFGSFLHAVRYQSRNVFRNSM